MIKVLIFTVVILSTVQASFGNFSGFESAKLGAFGDTLNILKDNKIIFEKERLYLQLGQRIQFHGEYWFSNKENREQKLIFAFPQESFWEVQYQHKKKAFIPGDYYHFSPRIKVNGVELKTVYEKFSLPVSDFTKIVFLTRDQMYPILVKYGEHHEAEDPAQMLFFIWKMFDYTFPAGSEIKIEVEFTMPWFYEDETWSDDIRTDGIRYFEYITSTARSWAGGKIKDFQAQVSYPRDVGTYLHLAPAGWKKVKEGVSVLSRKDYTPTAAEHLYFAWRSDYFLDIPHEIKEFNDMNMKRTEIEERLKLAKSCWSSLYYKDYHWRFLTDHSVETTWAFAEEGLQCSKFNIFPVGDTELNLIRKKSPLKGNQAFPSNEGEGKEKTVKRIKIVSGYAKSSQLFLNNNRPKEIEFFFKEGDEKWTQAFLLKDSWQPQFFDLQKPGIIPYAFSIRQIYKGKSSTDTCISELAFVE